MSACLQGCFGVLCLLLVVNGPLPETLAKEPMRKTVATIEGETFRINGQPTYKGRTWKGKKIGEGTRVSIVGYVESAHYSDVNDGESVNCELTGDENNDIHVPIVQTAGADECSSVTAEITPHYRPNVWTAANLNKPQVPLRFTGHLLFDAEHKPCRGTTVEEPKRQSVWEVHPVYSIDVCVANNVSQCDASDEKVWLALDTWLKQQPPAKH